MYDYFEDLLFLQTTLEEPLDLRFFNCRDVNVSIAVVTRNGTSNFTDPITVYVYGG